ncbi:hypothetical protein J437_LFUL016245 [Ladona fulva]|uniref:Transposase n=1 Tax=Ladona fulva TaxID=123851 RepID=A0A8K0KSE7_LADFU|nr:hypothetical protein J437_LFUL016245 [Ladona fulva]
MGSNNVKALKLLGYSYDSPFFLFNGQEIFTMHDPPHLLKCTRNMFMKYPVRGRVMLGGEMIQGLGRWSHIREIYGSARDIETTTMSRHLIPVKPLTEEHLNPTWRQKIKVSLAAGVFLQNVVKAMEWYQVFGKLSLDSLVTTTFLGFFCNLFQSFNGVQSDKIRVGFRGVVCKRSGHLDLWESALDEIKTWDFIKEGRHMKPRSSEGWVITIKAAKQLWVKLKGAGFSYLEPRRLNQDPLENFFGSIRLHCGSARNPTVMQFASGFKTTLIKNVSANWTKRMNSFKDHDQLIAKLDILLQRIPSSQEETENSIAEDFVREISIVAEEAAPLVSAESITMDISLSECCSGILRMLLKNNTCSLHNTCASLLTADTSVLPETLASAEEPTSAGVSEG